MTGDTTRPTGDPRTLGQHEARPPVGPPSPVAPPPAPTGAPVASSLADEGPGTTQAAREEAGKVAGTAKEQASRVADTARQETRRTVGEARHQAQDLLRQGQSELSSQAAAQQERLASGLRSFSSELDRLAEGAEEPGPATQVARWASHVADNAGRWLEDRDPSSVMDEVRRYARRRPGTFILAAAGLGLVVGRVARSLKDSTGDDSSAASTGSGTSGYRSGTGYRGGTAGDPRGSGYESVTYGTTTPAPVGGTTGRPLLEEHPPGLATGVPDQGGSR